MELLSYLENLDTIDILNYSSLIYSDLNALFDSYDNDVLVSDCVNLYKHH